MTKRMFFSGAILSLTLALAVGCNTTPTQDGAVVGGLGGAGLGAIIGHQSGHQGEGALIGAAAGALTGALVGDKVDERRDRYQEQSAQPRNTQAQSSSTQPVRGHYEHRLVTTGSGETYEERVWVPDR